MNGSATNTYDAMDPVEPRHLHLVHATDDLGLEDLRTAEEDLGFVGPADTMEPAPPRRTGLIVAGALGGGAIIGGGLVLALGGLFAVVAGAAAGFYLLGSDASVEPAAVEPAAVESTEGEVIGGDPTVAEPVDAAPSDTEAAVAEAAPSTPAPETRPAPTAAPVRQAATTAPAPAEVPTDPVTVKLLTDPPAAVVTIDGVEVGRTPLKLDLTPGSHAVALEAGKASGAFDIVVGGGQDRWCFDAKGRKLRETGC